MTNKVYVDVTMSFVETKKGNTFIQTTVALSGANIKNPDKTITVKLKPNKPMELSKFQVLMYSFDNMKEINGVPTISFKNVQARLYQGENYYGIYRFVKVFMMNHIIFSCFLEASDYTLISQFMNIEAEFSSETSEKVEFEPIEAI